MGLARRDLLKSLFPAVLAMVFPTRLLGKKAAPEESTRTGDIAASEKKVEISATLKVDALSVLQRKTNFEIYGDGHSHPVLLTDEAWNRLLKDKRVSVVSGFGGGEPPHRHWVSVELT